MMQEQKLRPSALAAALGLTVSAISKAIKRGKLWRDEHGWIDIGDARNAAFFQERIRDLHRGARQLNRQAEGAEETLLAIQKRKLRAAAQKLEVEVARLYGQLIDRSIVESAMGALNQAIMTCFLEPQTKWAAQICQLLGCIGREREVEEYLARDIERGLEEVKAAALRVIEAGQGQEKTPPLAGE